MKYKVINRPNPRNRKAPGKFHGTPVWDDRVKVLTTLLLVVLLLAGCGNDLGQSGSDPGDGLMPVRVAAIGMSVDVGSSEVSETRVATTIKTNDAKMGMFRRADAAKGYTEANNVEYTYSTETSMWSNTSSPILVGYPETNLYAYYPYGAATFIGSIATLTARKYDAANDLSYATGTTGKVTKKAPNASFTMKRAYSRVSLSITRDATYRFACSISNVKFRNGAAGTFYPDATVDISSGTITLGTVSDEGVDLDPGITGITSGATNIAADFLLPPQTVDKGLFISLTTDGAAMSVTIPASTLNTLEAGQQYGITLLLKGSSLQLDNVETQDWTEETVGSEYETH